MSGTFGSHDVTFHALGCQTKSYRADRSLVCDSRSRSLAIEDPSILCEVVHHVTIFNHILLSLPNLTHVSLPFHLLTNYTLVALHDSKTISTFVITDFNVDRTSHHFSLDHRRMLAVRPGPRPQGRPRLSIVGLAGTVPTNTTPARIRSFHEYMRNLWVYDIRYTTLRLSIFTHSPPTTAAVQLFHELGPLTTVGAWALPPNPRLETVVLEMGERSLAFGYAWMAKVFGAQPSITRCEVVVLPSGAGSVPPTDGAEPSFDLEGKKGLPFWRDGKMETSVPAAKWAQLPMVEIRAIYAPCAKDRAAEADDDAKKVEWGVKELEVKFAEGASVGVAAVSEFFKEAFVDKRTCERVVMMGGKWNDPAWAVSGDGRA